MLNVSARARVETLWKEMSLTMPPYPNGVVPVPEPIPGTAFFPGGLGLWLTDSAEPESHDPNIMVVGQDFNTAATYEAARRQGSEVHTSRTWRNIKEVFPKLGLPLRNCYFTNFYMGLRASGPETGRFPGAASHDFVQRSAMFFKRQMEVMRPQLIVTLGTAPLHALGRHVFQIPTPNTLHKCEGVYRDLPAPHGPVALVALTHPSLYFANVGKRRYECMEGMKAEQAMMQSAGKSLGFGLGCELLPVRRESPGRR